MNRDEKKLRDAQIYSLTEYYPPLPDFSRFHKAFQPHPGTPEGDLRKAFFLAYREELCEHMTLNECDNEMYSGRELVSANFVIPYPPGFPILVPGQVVSKEIVNFMKVLDVTEIHGYRHDLGLRVFSEETLQQISLGKTVAEIELKTNGNTPKKTAPSRKRKKKSAEETVEEKK
jgi:arginine decarboxylase